MRTYAMALSCLAACTAQPETTSAPSTADREKQVERPESEPSNPSATAASQPATTAPFPKLTGTVVLGEGIRAEEIPSNAVVFVMARTVDGGRLAATEIHEAPSFPLQFTLDEADVMGHGTTVKPPFKLYARLDRDRDALTKGPDDLYADFETPVTGSEKDVRLVLKKRSLPEGHPAPGGSGATGASSRPASQPAAH